MSGGGPATCRVRRTATTTRWCVGPRRAARSHCQRSRSKKACRPQRSEVGLLDVTIIDFAAHTAFLEPLTGTGFLLLPPAEHDISAPAGHFVEVAWSEQAEEFRHASGLSLLRADWEYTLRELDQIGWFLLDDENGAVEVAGPSRDGRLALCIYGEDSIIDEPDLGDIRKALEALRVAADLSLDD